MVLEDVFVGFYLSLITNTMFSKYICVIFSILLIGVVLSIPIEDYNIKSPHRQKRSGLTKRQSSSYSALQKLQLNYKIPDSVSLGSNWNRNQAQPNKQFNLGSIPTKSPFDLGKWSIGGERLGSGNFRVTPMYSINDKLQVGPSVNYKLGQGITGIGAALRYRWK